MVLNLLNLSVGNGSYSRSCKINDFSSGNCHVALRWTPSKILMSVISLADQTAAALLNVWSHKGFVQ